MNGRRLFKLYVLLPLSLIHTSYGQDEGNVTAEPGQNHVTLPCVAAGNKPVIIVKWWRTDLGKYDNVLLYRDEQLDEENQHRSFKDRVSLQDGEVKTANVSLVLRNVTADDKGTYKCEVAQKEPDGSNSGMKLIRTIYLDVVPPQGNQDGSREQETEEGTNEGTSQRRLGLIASVVFVLIIGILSLVLCSRNQNG